MRYTRGRIIFFPSPQILHHHIHNLMKLRLPKLLLTALLTAIGASASHADDSSSLTLGDVMYVGDSITHGYYEASYRWALHKIFVDNGVSYTEVGHTTNNTGGDYAGDSYRGVTFENKHSATSGIRAWDVAGKNSKTDTTYTDKPINGILDTTSASTFVLLLGTNDLLSDNNPLTNAALETVTNNLLGTDRKSGDIGHIVDTMYESNPNATLYVSTIPCWTLHQNNDGEEPHAAVASYNESLKTWVANYNTANSKNIKLVDVNRGMIDVAAAKPFYGVSSMFKNPGTTGDGLHPNAQGELIIAGNMARAMGIAGRTAGAERKAAEDFSHVVTNDGSNLNLTTDAPTLSFSWSESDSALTPAAGFTAELMGFTFGNGEYNTWNTTDNFTFTIGNGSNLQGSLSINEAYIQWDSTILFSENMSTLSENIRMAYITGDSANGINSGFYVWLGDMLIGEALGGTETSTALNGVSISYSGTSSYTLQGVAMDSTGAYAPTSTLAHLISAPAATAQGVVTVPTGVTESTGVIVVNKETSVPEKLYANEGDHTGNVWCRVSSGQYPHWTGAHTGGTLTGNVTMIFDGAYKGTGTAFGIVNGSEVTGNVTLQFDAADAVYGSWTKDVANYASVVGSFSGAIDGTFKAVINAGAFQYDILGGSFNGSSIGGTDIYINGGSVGRNVYGGSQKGTVGSTSVTITGGYVQGNVYGGGRGNDDANKITGSTSVTITGGTINGDIYAGGSGGNIKGDTALTIDGNLPTLHGKLLSAGGSAGTIEGNATLTIKNATANNYIASIDKFTGTLSGGENVVKASTLVFENTQLSGTAFNSVTVEHFDTINLTNGSNVTLGATALDGANGSTISLTGGSQLTVGGNFSSTAGLNITGGGGSVTLAGQTNTFGGGISVAEGNTLTLSGDLAFNIEDGDFDVSYTYDTTRTTNGLGDVTVRVSGLDHLFSVEGSLNTDAVDIVTVNGSVVDINALASESATYTKEDVVYYAMTATHLEAPSDPLTGRAASVYSLGDGSEILMSEVVHVGNHKYSGPAATADTHDAQGFYVGEKGVLCIMGDSDTMLAGDILETTQGSGKIFLRSPGYTDVLEDGGVTTMTVQVDSATKATGSLYLAPYEIASWAAPQGQPGVFLHLADGADVTSLSEINYGYPQSQIMIDGHIESNTEGIHIKSLNALGCGTVYFAVNQWANEKLQLGNVTITSYEHGNGGIQPGKLYIDINHLNSNVVIHHLGGGETVEGVKPGNNGVATATPELYFSTGQLDNYGAKAESISGVLDIDSFDYRGKIWLSQSRAAHKLHVNINLIDTQWLNDFQYGRYPNYANSTLTIKGSGTYILSEGNSIKDNFGLLSTEYEEDGVTRIWTGTVEVNNLVANDVWNSGTTKNGLDFSLYGNEQSTVHFKGFKGYLTDATTAVEIKQDLILENTYNEDDSLNMNAYEITGGDEGQAQTYTGNIRGTGDFVVSAGSNMSFNLQGDISKWAADGTETPEFIVQKNTQALNFSGNATEVNAIIKVAPSNATEGATLNVSVGDANSEHTTTFNESVVASSLTTYAQTTAQFKGDTTRIGKVNLGAVDAAAPAVIEHGMVISGNTVQGGEASNTVMSFVGEGAVSDAKLKNVVLTSTEAGYTESIPALQSKVSINLKNLTAEDVYLSGAANFESLDTQANFEFDKTIEAFGQTYNEVIFESSSFSGMTLQGAIAELGYLGNITLTVADGITVADSTEAWKGTDAPTNVSIFLEGFSVEGLTIGKRMEGMFAPLQFSIMNDSTQVAALSESSAMSVSQLLNYDSYREVYFVQQEDGLFIRMSNIPEPTTATLSMLALAALASRRRRRK